MKNSKVSSYLFISLLCILLDFSFSNQGYSEGAITLLSNFPVPNSTFITDVWGYYDSNANKEYALITDNYLGLFIIDVTEPTNPSLVSQVNTIPGFDVKGWQHYVYTVNGGGSGTGGIVDISAPGSPQVVGSFPSSHNIFIADNGYMYLEYPGLRIYNLNPDPTNPTLVWNDQSSGGHDATVVGNILYDFHGSQGTFIYDVTNPSNPQQLGAITDPSITYHHSGWISPDGQFLYICDELAQHPQADISIWNISNPGNPQRVGQYADGNATVHNFIVRGNYGFTSYYTAGFRVFDISNPAQLSLASEYDTSPQSGEGYAGAFGVYPLAPSGNIYVSDWDNGLFVFSFADSSTTGTGQLAGVPHDYELHQNYPNPFNPSTTIKYEVPGQSYVSIDVFNLLGQKVRNLVSETKQAGMHSVEWDGKDEWGNPVPSGIYFYRMSSPGFNDMKRMILIK
jgi:choice-of-anchor B domain-containing protein